MAENSLAVRQVAMGDAQTAFPLFPPLVSGLPPASDGAPPRPLELDFDYAGVDREAFLKGSLGPSAGLGRWAPLMPPLTPETNLGEGDTPMLETPRLAAWAGVSRPLYIKDEGRNPTWSHKDRLNRCTVSAAQLADAPGIIVASSGNHGASASAYAAAAGLPCIVLASATAPLAMQAFVAAYGGAALAVPAAARWGLMEQLRRITGYHPVSNLTPEAHTGHSFAIEGYKSIAYEIVRDLAGEVPGSVFVPTGYGELIYGVWKGFEELRMLGLTASTPKLFSCESAIYGVLYRAMRDGLPVARIQPNTATQALSIATPVGGLRVGGRWKRAAARPLPSATRRSRRRAAPWPEAGFGWSFLRRPPLPGCASLPGADRFRRERRSAYRRRPASRTFRVREAACPKSTARSTMRWTCCEMSMVLRPDLGLKALRLEATASRIG